MSIALCTIVYEGMPYIRRLELYIALEYVDRWFVAEGSVPAAAAGETSTPYQSQDGTAEYLDQLDRRQPRAEILCLGQAESKLAMWNACLEAGADRYDFVLFLDSDEVFVDQAPHPRSHAEYLEHSGAKRLDYEVIHLFRNGYTQAIFGPYAEPFRRMWRVEPGDRFVSHRPQSIDGPGETSVVYPFAQIEHSGWCDQEKALEKCEFYRRLRPNHPTYGRHVGWYWEVFANHDRTEAVHITEIDGSPYETPSKLVRYTKMKPIKRGAFL